MALSRKIAPGKAFEMRCDVDRMVEIGLIDSNSEVLCKGVRGCRRA